MLTKNQITAARRFNVRHAPPLPPGGAFEWPDLYGDTSSEAFARATHTFQKTFGLGADGMFGAVTFSAFDARYGEAPLPSPPHTSDTFDLQVWVSWGHLSDAELAWLAELGVTTLHFNLNKADGPSKWVWDGRRKDIADNARRAKQAGFRVSLMVWMYRDKAFCHESAYHTLELADEVGADEVQFDVEGHWVHRGKGGALGDDEKVQEWWRPAWCPAPGGLVYTASPLYFTRPSVDALLDEPEISVLYPQAYSPWMPGKPDTHAKWFRAPHLQRKALANHARFNKPVIVGIGGWQQRAPGGPSPQEAMMLAAQASYDGGAHGVCLWTLNTIQPGTGRGWPEEQAHREGWEQVCRHFAGRPLHVRPLEAFTLGEPWIESLRDPYKPPVPPGYTKVRRPLPSGFYDAARRLRAFDSPLGTYTPFTAGDRAFVGVDCLHTHKATPKGPVEIPGGIHGITVYERV